MSASKSAAHDCAVIVWRSLGTCCNVSRLEPDCQIAGHWLPGRNDPTLNRALRQGSLRTGNEPIRIHRGRARHRKRDSDVRRGLLSGDAFTSEMATAALLMVMSLAQEARQVLQGQVIQLLPSRLFLQGRLWLPIRPSRPVVRYRLSHP